MTCHFYAHTCSLDRFCSTANRLMSRIRHCPIHRSRHMLNRNPKRPYLVNLEIIADIDERIITRSALFCTSIESR